MRASPDGAGSMQCGLICLQSAKEQLTSGAHSGRQEGDIQELAAQTEATCYSPMVASTVSTPSMVSRCL